MTVQKVLRGACLCRVVVYEVADAFDYAMNCHCADCRRATGAAFKSFAGIAPDRLAIVEGHDNFLVFGDRNYDAHCKTCGSLLYSVVRGGAFVHVTMGTLIDAPGIRPQRHIFVGSKAPWYTITDDLPQHERFPPS